MKLISRYEQYHPGVNSYYIQSNGESCETGNTGIDTKWHEERNSKK